MSASADVLAQAKVEIDLAAIPEGKNVSTQAGDEVGYATDLPRRLLSNGVVSQYSSATEQRTRSRKPKTPTGTNYEILSPTRTESRSLSG